MAQTPMEREAGEGLQPGKAIGAHWRAGSDAALVAVSGFDAGRPGRPAFHFRRATRHLPVTRLYVRDAFEAWFHDGLPGLGGDIVAATDGLMDMLAARGISRVVFLGVSSGGYAALAMGWLAGVTCVKAISPRTTLDAEKCRAWGDNRRPEAFARLHARAAAGPGSPPRSRDELFDLADVLAMPNAAGTRYDIYYDPENAIDHAHAENIAGLPHVRLEKVSGGGHLVGRRIMREPWFMARLERALAIIPS